MLIGLTGGIGAGKSTVAEAFARRGARTLDADQLAREVVEPGTPGLAAVVARFGREVLDETGALDRAALAEIVFADPEARADLEAIIHPAVLGEIARRVAAEPPGAMVIVEVPLLVERRIGRYDAVVVVEADEEIRVTRLVGRGMRAEDARARIRAQASDDERRAHATFVVENNGDREALEHEVERVWVELRRLG